MDRGFHKKSYPRLVREKLTDTQKAYFERNFSGVEYSEDAQPRSHVLLHYTRNFLEVEMYEMLERYGITNVVDIGGTATRSSRVAAAHGVNYHSCNPILDGTDAIRVVQARLTNPSLDVSCCHTAQDCDCTNPQAYVSIHAVYYLTPTEIARLCYRATKRVVFAVVHEFRTVNGYLPHGHKEAYYELKGDMIIMQTGGNAHKYAHPSCLWMQGGGVATEVGTLSWNVVREVEGTLLIMFTVSNACVPVSRWDATIPGTDVSDDDLRGLRNTQTPIGHVLVKEGVDKITVTRWGFVVYTGSGQVLVPKELLAEAQLFIVGKKRTFENWQLLLQKVKGQVGKLNVAAELQWKTVLMCCALAFVKTSEMEATVYGYMARYRWLYAQVARFVDVRVWWSPVFVTSKWFKMIVVGLATMMGLSSTGWFRRLMGLASVVGGLSLLGQRYFKPSLTQPNLMPPSKYSADPMQLPNPSVGRFTAVPEDLKIKEAPGNTQIVTVDNQVATRCTNDDPTTIRALAVRMLAGTEHADWKEVEDTKLFWEEWLWPRQNLTVPTFEQWLRVCNRRNDKARCDALRKAKRQVCEDPSLIRFTLQPFVKDEAYVGKGLNPKPRLICATNDHYLVATAPLCYALTKVAKTAMNSKHFVYFTSGATTLELGQFYQQALDDFPGGKILEVDFSQWESRVSVEAMEVEFNVYEALTDCEIVDLLRMQIRQSGSTRTGIKWNREGGRASGVGNTSVGNSILNALAHLTFFKRFRDPVHHVRMMVLGDDNLTVMSAEMARLFDVVEFETFMMDLGMSPEVKLHDWNDALKAEYCSGWFPWYDHLIDGVTTSAMCWSPKVGKVLSKTFSVKPTDRDGPRTIKGICLGLAVGPTCPLLRVCLSVLIGEIRAEGVMPEWTEYQPTPVKLTGRVVVPLENVASRYDLTDSQCQALENYFKDKFTGEWPINLSTEECPPLKVVIDLDCPDGDIETITANLNFSRPNLTMVNRLPVTDIPEQHRKGYQARRGRGVLGSARRGGRGRIG